ncbi:MAG: hypothetical protein KBB88_03540 [Candidatus Pacebacteria bacterium]|nr:hypothetical protein [Candidatus Paceibacterota bacterium]
METITTNNTNNKVTPHFFFITLGMVVSLMVTAVGFLNLIFETLDNAFPDVLNASYQFGYNTYQYEGVRSALAIVIIAFPVFFILTRLWRKRVRKGLGHGDEVLKKWVVYGLLFLITLTAFIDLIILVQYFVAGEITLRFVLKVVAVIVVVKLLGLYYLDVLKKMKWSISQMIPAISIAVVLAGIVYSFVVIGSPLTQRELRLDQKRLEDLQNIQSQVLNYWQEYEKLPDSLKAMIDPLQSWQHIPVDPEFEKGVLYEYSITGKLSFELCATFSRPIPVGWQEYSAWDKGYPMREDIIGPDSAMTSSNMMAPYGGGITNESWDHQVGRTCFQRTIDPERYQPYKISER